MLQFLKDSGMKKTKRREPFPSNIILHFFYSLAEQTVSRPILGISIFFIWIPAALYGCSLVEQELPGGSETTVRFLNEAGNTIGEVRDIDLLIFNDDRLQKLDTYQKVSPASCSTVKAASGSGEKIMTAIANGQRDRFEWADINSRKGLDRITATLEKEDRNHLLMSGECRCRAGGRANLSLQRLCSEICLRSISCDFKGRPYEGLELENVRVYLTNVNAEASVISEQPYHPVRIINAGALNESDATHFMDRSMIIQEIDGRIDSNVRNLNISLLCYPNEAEEEGPGTPFTKLVIEGRTGGETYYWPLEINRKDGASGISRNSRYIYDVRIRRLGQYDPDTTADPRSIDIMTEVKAWEEREEYGVRF